MTVDIFWAVLFNSDVFKLQALEPNCLRLALMFKIPDILQEMPAGMHVTELGTRCGVEPSKLARVLRLLSAKHCFREGTPKSDFRNEPQS
jgi:hypothetical protein